MIGWDLVTRTTFRRRTSCAHQAQLGWMRRHSWQLVALPLVHMLRPGVGFEGAQRGADHRDNTGTQKQRLTVAETQTSGDKSQLLFLGLDSAVGILTCGHEGPFLKLWITSMQMNKHPVQFCETNTNQTEEGWKKKRSESKWVMILTRVDAERTGSDYWSHGCRLNRMMDDGNR